MTTTLAADGERTAVEVPSLPVAEEAGERPDPAPVVVEKTERKSRSRTIAGVAVAGVGVVMFGGSIVIALGAKSDYDAALDRHCGGDPDACSQAGVDETDAARGRGNLATAIGAVGLAAVAGGLYLWITAPTETVEVRRGAALVPVIAGDGAGLALTGAW